ncbi:mitochondrial carrier domain-containing protein [Amylostereum chailletii]|nr:mitochondrial carrier domain-containing protein [Amylostereum chailletii]
MSSNAHAKPRQKNFDHFLRSGIAGGVAGCVAKTVVAPLDRVKILFQASNPEFQKYAGSWSGAYRAGSRIYSETGMRGLLQGHSATLFRVFPYAAVKFIAYDQVHDLLMPTPAHETNFRRFASGAISGAISVFFTYPLELIRVRMAFQTQTNAPKPTPVPPPSHIPTSSSSSSTHVPTPPHPPSSRPSLLSAARQIYHEGSPAPGHASPSTKQAFHTVPLLKFYRGFTVSLVGMVPYAGTAFLTWGYLRARLLPQDPRTGRRASSPLADLGIGGAAGVLAQTVSYPFEVVRRRMQVGGLTQPGRWLRWGETVRAVWARGGWRGFYVGLSIGYLKVIPMNAVSFAVWQGMKRVLDV